MKIEAVSFGGATATTKLMKFTLTDEASNYIFDFNDCQGLCNNLNFLKGIKFSTPDRDNDMLGTNCASNYFGGWWFKSCFRIYFNGKYSNGEKVTSRNGIQWREFRGVKNSLKETKIMIRRVQ